MVSLRVMTPTCSPRMRGVGSGAHVARCPPPAIHPGVSGRRLQTTEAGGGQRQRIIRSEEVAEAGQAAVGGPWQAAKRKGEA